MSLGGGLVAWCVAPTTTPPSQQAEAAAATAEKDSKGGGGATTVGPVPPAPAPDDDNGAEDECDATGASALVCDVFRWLISSRLPPHMVPTRFGYMRRLPNTATGKVARAPLMKMNPPPAPDRHAYTPRPHRPPPAHTHSYLPPLGLPALPRGAGHARLHLQRVVCVCVCVCPCVWCMCVCARRGFAFGKGFG